MLGAQTYGSLGIFRSLGRLGVSVDAVDVARERPASRSRYLRRRIVDDLANRPADDAVDRLLDLAAGYSRPPILVPTSDELAVLVARHANRLRPAFVLPDQPPDLPAMLADKQRMQTLAQAHGVPTPAVVYPTSMADIEAYAESGRFPVMLKGIDGHRLQRRTGRKMVIVERSDALADWYRRLEDPERPNLMLQEYIPGGDDTIWMFNGYFAGDGRCLVGFTGRKLRQTPAYTGVTSLGVCERNDVVHDLTTRWMAELGYRGILDIGYRFDARDGSYRVLDANPRIGMTFRLFVGTNGIDVIRALYRDLTGQPVQAGEPREGRKWIVEGGDFDSFRTYRRDGRLGVLAWLRSLRGIEEAAHFARDDPRPFLAVTGGNARRRLRG